MDDKTLMHYGVKGMHWGVRRYQPYPDGVTPRKKGDSPNKKISKPPSNKEIYKRSKTMSDDELRTANKRLQAEENYRQNMMKEKRAYTNASVGRSAANKILNDSTKQFSTQLAVGLAGAAGLMIGKAAFNAAINHAGNISMPQLLVWLSAK